MILNASSIVQYVIQLKNETIIHAKANTKKIIPAKKYYSWNHRTFICENGQYLKGVADTSVIVCDEIINSTDSASRNVTKAISTNVMSTLSTNFHNKKVRYNIDSYILHAVSSDYIIICNCYYLLSFCKT